jgi:membrane-bound inhibitor of C-type lysozyme
LKRRPIANTELDMSMKIIAGLSAGLALAFAASAAMSKDAPYRCADGTRFTARFDNSGTGQVTLSFGGASAPLVLPQAMSADGGRYTDQSTEFWIKGKSARFTRGSEVTTCSTR